MYRTTLILSLFLCFQAAAQSDKLDKLRTSENKGLSIELPPLSITNLRSTNPDKREAFEFAKRRDVELTPFNSGQWTQKENYWEWTIDIHSPGALSLNLGFTEYQLPTSSSLTIENQKGQRLGPFTKSDNKDHSQLWTPNLDGDKIYLKLQVPEEHLKEIQLKLSAVNHGYRRPELRSGDCNLDIACGDDGSFSIINQFQDQIRSVAVVQINGRFECSGFLINNTQNNFEPYFVTAAHCGITAQNGATTVFYWNYQNSTCRQPNSVESGEVGDGLLDQFNTGATFVSSAINGNLDPQSVDFTLMRLDDPVDPDFRPYFAGWDIRPQLPDTTAVIHHPNAEEKRISFDFQPPQFEVFGSDTIFVRVLDYEIGTTEGGSSGAPLFSPQGRAIGFVSGGSASCFNLSGFDQYGWLGMAWRNGDSPQTRMRDWIDPDNSGIQLMDGLDGSFAIRIDNASERLCGIQKPSIQREITVDPNFSGPVQLSISNQPEEIVVSLLKSQLAPGESTTITLENIDRLESGNYQILIDGTDGTNQNSNAIRLEVIENVPGIVTGQSPSQNEILVESLATFMWNGDGDGFEIEISEQVDFSNPIIRENDLIINRFSTTDLNENAEYFWRVRSTNFCGQSKWSDPIKFRTSNLDCTQYITDNLAIEIGEERGDIAIAEIEVGIDQSIAVVNVPLIAGTHSWSGDLVFSLISPEGTEITLGENLCEVMQFMDFAVGFSDEGFPLSSLPCPFTDGRTYQPEDGLDAFIGENPVGTWTLMLLDEFLLDGGFLQSFHLEICAASDRQLSSLFEESSLNACGVTSVSSSFQVSNDFTEEVQISAISSNDALDVDLDQTTGNPGEVINFTIKNVNLLDDITSSVRFIVDNAEGRSESIVVIDFESDLAEFDLLQPANNTILEVGSSFDFEWEDVENNTGYVIQLSVNDPLFTEPTEVPSDSNLSDLALVFDNFTGDNETVFWRVIANGENCNQFSETFSFILDLSSAVTEINGTTISILPNPFESFLEIDFSQPLDSDTTIELFDLSGRQIQTQRVAKGDIQLSINTLSIPSGIYFIRLLNDELSIVEKLVKQ